MSRSDQIPQPMAVGLADGNVVLTMSRQRAQEIADSITIKPRDNDDAEWFEDLVTWLSAAAKRRGLPSRAMPTIAREAYWRGGYTIMGEKAQPAPTDRQ